MNANAELEVMAAPAVVVAEPSWLAEARAPRKTPVRSLVASVNALFRFAETRLPEERRILADPWAGDLAEGLWLQAMRYARFVIPPLYTAVEELRTAHCVRHRSIDELVLRAVERDGYRQVVVLGAGYDMRASRFATRLLGVSWFEVDLPSLSARKRTIVEGLPETNKRVRYVPLDLAAGSLVEALAAAGFDPERPACFVMEGLVHYLTADALGALVAEIVRGRGRRRVVLSFIRSDMYLAAGSPLRGLIRLMREIPRLHFTWPELAHLFARHGLLRFEAWTFAGQLAAFAPMARGRRVGSSQDVGQVDREA